jgi:hypothetical protein
MPASLPWPASPRCERQKEPDDECLHGLDDSRTHPPCRRHPNFQIKGNLAANYRQLCLRNDQVFFRVSHRVPCAHPSISRVRKLFMLTRLSISVYFLQTLASAPGSKTVTADYDSKVVEVDIHVMEMISHVTSRTWARQRNGWTVARRICTYGTDSIDFACAPQHAADRFGSARVVPIGQSSPSAEGLRSQWWPPVRQLEGPSSESRAV